MTFGYTIIYVEDVTQTIAFYEQAFGFNRIFITPEGDYGELQTGETTIAFASIALGHSNFTKGYTPLPNQSKPIGIELAFVSTEIEVDFQKALDAGATEFEPLQTKPWGQQVGYLLDLNGMLIEICTPIQT